MGDFQINIQQQGINFFGNPRRNGYIPGYLFKVHEAADFRNLKQMLTRCLFETQNKVKHDKAEDFDESYLE